MARLIHGSVVRLEEVHAAVEAVRQINKNSSLPFNLVGHSPLTSFGYMFGGLQSKGGALLPDSTDEEAARTVENLKLLGMTMVDKGDPPGSTEGDSAIPSLYTYFGQFLAHDITLEAASKDLDLDKATLRPLAEDEVRQNIKNTRTATLDLDSVYGDDKNPVPTDDDDKNLLQVGRVSHSGFLPPGSDVFNDVPREGYNKDDPTHDRAARIGDVRNDENVITSQLHVAFLRAHNAIVRDNHTFNEARVILRQHFQWVVLHDFLKRIADPEVVESALDDPQPFYNPPESEFFLPLEFTAAAYRFGHSMVRDGYDYNPTLSGGLRARLYQTFNPMGKKWRALPDQWVIGWDNFVDNGRNRARRIDTQLVEPLFTLLGPDRGPLKNSMARLAVRNLLRGYVLRLPTGQAVARELGLVPLSEGEVIDAAYEGQREVLEQTGLAAETPLWFYVLAEAAHARAKAAEEGKRVDHLGPVGSRIVAEVIVGLIRRSEDSILSVAGWEPTLPKKGDIFVLPDILRLAGVLRD